MERYIRSIKNPHKRAYAEAYACYLRSDGAACPPERPRELGFMGGQAVEISLRDLHRAAS